MIKKLVLLRSLPGGGKTTIAKEYKKSHKGSCYICSTDDYWLRPDGIYDFNFELLGKSHQWNQKRVEHKMMINVNSWYDAVIVVDNTNVTFNEMKPYINLALGFDYKIEFREPDTTWKYDVEECYKRNSHGVPYATILKMYQKFESQKIVEQKLSDMINKRKWNWE